MPNGTSVPDKKGDWNLVLMAIGGIGAFAGLVYAWSKGMFTMPAGAVPSFPSGGPDTDLTPPGDLGPFKPDDEGDGGLLDKKCPDGSKVQPGKQCGPTNDGPLGITPSSFEQGKMTTFYLTVGGSPAPKGSQFRFCKGINCQSGFTDSAGRITMVLDFTGDVVVKGWSQDVKGRSITLIHQPSQVNCFGLSVGPSGSYDPEKKYNDFYLKCSGGGWLAGGTDLNLKDMGTGKNWNKTLGNATGAASTGHSDWKNVFVLGGSDWSGDVVVSPTEGPAKGMSVRIKRG